MLAADAAKVLELPRKTIKNSIPPHLRKANKPALNATRSSLDPAAKVYKPSTEPQSDIDGSDSMAVAVERTAIREQTIEDEALAWRLVEADLGMEDQSSVSF